MVRGIAAVVSVVLLMSVVLLAFGPVMEGVGEEVKSFDSIDDGDLHGTETINDFYRAFFIYIPLIAVGGTILGAVVFYWVRERARGVPR